MDIPNTDSVNYAFASAQSQAMQYRHEFITPEHLLSALLEQVPFQKALAECFCTPEELSQSISEYLSKKVERVPQEIEYELEISGQLSELLQYAYMTISHSSAEEMDVPHLVQGMLQLEDSWAGYLLKETVGEDMPEFLSSLISNYEHMNQFQEETSSEQEKSEPWRNYVTCLNEGLQDRNPLIGRNVELERTIQVLCRKERTTLCTWVNREWENRTGLRTSCTYRSRQCSRTPHRLSYLRTGFRQLIGRYTISG